jgi:SOS-response transcriptional repressors (recA-mediated autopeptidases)
LSSYFYHLVNPQVFCYTFWEVIRMTIGERIREARTAKGLTQEQLAEQVHVTKQAVYKYETGIVTNIPLDKLESIAACLSVAPGYLAGWQGSPAGAELDALIQDEPIAAYQNLKDELTQADKEDIARLIQLRAELNRSKT